MGKVNILLATYNGETYIRKLLDSLVRQSWKDFVCYIHDDGSSDRTVAICREYCGNDPERFVLLDYPKTGGAKANFLSLMKYADGDYVFFCDQDDVWLPDKIEKMVQAAEKTGGECLVFCDLKVVDASLNTLSDSFMAASRVHPEQMNYRNTLIKSGIPGCAMMVTRGIMENASKLQDPEKIVMHDWWVILTALMTDAEIVFVNEPLVLYRQHEENAVGSSKTGTMDRARIQMKRVMNGTLRAEKKQDFERIREQAKALLDYGIGTEEKCRFVRDFLENGEKSKLSRIRFCRKNFQGTDRLWWLLFWV